MASKPVVTQQVRAIAGGGGKQKIPLGIRNNRKALEDIGNLVTVPVIDGKPKQEFSRPLTRSFCAQLLANAQPDAAENIKKPAAKVVNGAVEKKGAVPAKPARKKVNTKPKPDIAREVSPEHKEDTRKEKIASQKTSRRKAQTLTAILTARSKAACGLVNKSSDPIINIDTADVDNHLAMVDYVEDLYKFYKLEENSSHIQDYMGMQPDINEKMRAIIVDWLIEVHCKFELRPETLYLTINTVDRFLSKKVIPRRELQLVGIGAMLIASKYEELWAPEVADFVSISDMAYTGEQILAMEKAILGKLEWNLTVPTPYVFLVRFIKAAMADQKEIQIENLAFFMAEIGLMNYVAIMYCPSMLAASAVYAARCTLNKSPFWNETLKFHSGFSETQLMDCAKLLAKFHSVALESKLKGAYKKYSNPDYGAVALLPPAKILLTG
ncbi:G2/mitotic-specific cyclin S13-7-like isoform X2 [Telopea speciosissima]|uniref:G2/mitotic-specific cyclin S13-7-like isoform X2 n=1 Tax=Telopea speciosissima TaxID=54955 RepID=UPI001CC40540|nr:G2/mitotic-specific cyclin S13-7-like isoform X2 [Telopea speciosissima]